jgi:heme-degrading monooxygenase HmoA
MSRPGTIARLWQGRTRPEVADDYEAYLLREGVAKFRDRPGNLGVQMMRRALDDGTVEFSVISYWESLEAIQGYAGRDTAKTSHLARDAEYLVELPDTVKTFELKMHDWTFETR